MPRWAGHNRKWFLKRVLKTSKCWWWTGTTNGSYGYVVWGVNPREIRMAHRVAFELWKGPIPDGLWVLHRCDNPKCVRPSHLWLGTQTDNVRDCRDKGRLGWRKIKPEQRPRGEAINKGVLTTTLVRIIKRRWADGVIAREIASELNLKLPTVQGVCGGYTWKHVTDF